MPNRTNQDASRDTGTASFAVIPGAVESPVILHVPHSSTYIPSGVPAGIVLDDEALAA